MLKSLPSLLCLLFCFAPFRVSAIPPDAPLILPNGLQIILRQRHEKPLIALDLWIRAGSRDEQPGEGGCAHFLEHTLFKGTVTRKSGELDFAMESLGGIFTAATGPDYAHFGATIPPAALEPALALLSELARNAALPEVEIQRERGPILDELALHGADLQTQAIERAYALAYDTHPYRRLPGGTPADIRTRTRTELFAFYQRNYLPERAVIVLVGDFDSDAAKSAITKTFADWKPTAAKPAANNLPIAEAEVLDFRRADVPVPGREGRIALGFRVPPASDAAATRALRLLEALLGSSDGGGRLAIPALAQTHATARYTPRLEGSLFLITADLPPGNDADALTSAIQDILQGLQTSLPAPAALQSARQQALAQTRYDSETAAGMARLLGYAALVRSDRPEDLPRVLPLVKPQDTQKTALRYLDWKHRVEVRLLPAAAAPSLIKENAVK